MSSLIGILFGFGCLISSFLISGGSLSGLGRPTAAMTVFGGTIGAVIISFPAKDLKRFIPVLKMAFSNKKPDLPKLIIFFKDISSKTRRNGLLSLETELSSTENIDPFIKKGLQMVVDGLEPASVRSTLELQADVMSERHKDGYAIFNAAGGYSPTMGVVGTVMGLVMVLSNLSGDSAALAPLIAESFVATLYGVGFANLVWLPIGSKLKAMDKVEMSEKELIIEAVSLIQEGVNPNVIGEKLKSFLDGNELGEFEKMDKAVEA